MNKLLKVFLFIIFFALSAISYQLSAIYAQHEGHSAPQKKQDAEAKAPQAKKKYQCSMHPQVISDKPGKCPICGMELVEVPAQAQETAQAGTVKLKDGQQELIGVTTEKIVNRPLMRMVRTVAKIAFDPELYKAQTEFIQAYKTKKSLGPSASPELSQRLDALAAASAFKLRLQGLSDEQIEALKSEAEADRSLLISDTQTPYAWAYLTLYEYDLGSVKAGDHVVIKAIAYPGEAFSGKITAIDPVLDMNTRSARARVQVDNPQGKLKPNMYADALIHIDLGKKLSLPKEAVLDTGIRKIVYIDLGKGEFKAQEVEVGLEAIAVVDSQERKYFPVIKGLEENDIVVTSGNFLIDSQSQLSGGMSALWGASMEIGQEEPPAHRH